MWFDHVEHMEEGPEQNKEWENIWWTVDEDMFTYVMNVRRCSSDLDKQMDRRMCSLGVRSNVLVMLEVVNLARN